MTHEPETPEAILRAQAYVVMVQRQTEALLAEVLKDKRAEFEASITELTHQFDTAQAERLSSELTLRGLTLAVYQESGETKPGPGVAIQMRVGLVYNLITAYKWALEHKIALTLDKKAFEAIVKAPGSADIPFVSRNEVPTPTIATNLGKALGIEPEEGPF